MSRTTRFFTLVLLLVSASANAWAAAPVSSTLNKSDLDSELFFEVLVGELSAQTGDSNTAYAMTLKAARKSNSPRLFQRAVELALRARSGESALEAAQAWARAWPASLDANRHVLQILIGINRIAETQRPLERELAGFSPAERVVAINQLSRFYARATDRKLVTLVVERALARELTDRTTGPAAWAAIGIFRAQAADLAGAMEAVHRGSALDPKSQEPIFLAIALIDPKTPAAETVVKKFMANHAQPDIRMTYTRALLNAQRFADAYAQMQRLSDEHPLFTEAWLVRGSLELQNKQPMLAQASLKQYVALVTAPTPVVANPAPVMSRGLVQAYLLLAQIAEQNQNETEALSYLARIDGPQDALRVQIRKSAILARSGKMDEARAGLRAVPEFQPEDARAKVNAESQLLRDNQQYAQAYQVLADALARFPDDADLLYEQAMMAEKMEELGDMEQLLRRIIATKPNYHHAYNALGYSLADRDLRLPEARQLVSKALELAPKDPFIMDSMAWVEFRSGNLKEAVDLLRSAFATRPDAEIAAHLGEVLWASGLRAEAEVVWKQGIELNASNETLLETLRRLQVNP
jgi:tetratricopeptide (TPR) repeat protein